MRARRESLIRVVIARTRVRKRSVVQQGQVNRGRGEDPGDRADRVVRPLEIVPQPTEGGPAGRRRTRARSASSNNAQPRPRLSVAVINTVEPSGANPHRERLRRSPDRLRAAAASGRRVRGPAHCRPGQINSSRSFGDPGPARSNPRVGSVPTNCRRRCCLGRAGSIRRRSSESDSINWTVPPIRPSTRWAQSCMSAC